MARKAAPRHAAARSTNISDDIAKFKEDADWKYSNTAFDVWHGAYVELQRKDTSRRKTDATSRYLLDEYFPAKLTKYNSKTRKGKSIAGGKGADVVFPRRQCCNPSSLSDSFTSKMPC